MTLSPVAYDPAEIQTAKQVDAILRQFEKSHDAMQLIEMNGDKCAQRQLARLQIYDRPMRSPVE
jgi:cell fate (sporulation/competence/biofilm development) regulator YlbF (YheA/YmcA/DUF963 family)